MNLQIQLVATTARVFAKVVISWLRTSLVVVIATFLTASVLLQAASSRAGALTALAVAQPAVTQNAPTMLTASATAGGGNPASSYVSPSSGDPVNDATLDFYQTYTDVSIPGRGPALDLTRTYNSLTAYYEESPFGYGWSGSYFMSLSSPGSDATVNQENGSTVTFSDYVAPAGAYATLDYNSSSNTYTYVRKGTQTFVFNSTGQLISESDPNGYTTTLSYTSGKLTTVTDPEGRTLTFAYGTNGLV